MPQQTKYLQYMYVIKDYYLLKIIPKHQKKKKKGSQEKWTKI